MVSLDSFRPLKLMVFVDECYGMLLPTQRSYGEIDGEMFNEGVKFSTRKNSQLVACSYK